MKVHQFYDEGLAHASYAVVSEHEMALVDPGRDPQPYIAFAKEQGADIKAVFETHPHADFTSSQLEFLNGFGAKVYVHPDMGVHYDHISLKDGEEATIGKATFRALDTPGHSPDHNSYLLLDEEGKEYGVFTGDSLFIGDVGRPDLRENAGNFNLTRSELAGKMYETMQKVFKPLPDHVKVYPAHGAGSLCGKNMSDETISTIGQQREDNWSFSESDKTAFVEELLSGQPNVPKYFPFDVEENRRGVAPFLASVQKVPRLPEEERIGEGHLIVDSRPSDKYKDGHITGSINIPDDDKFETWLGTLVDPETPYYLVAETEENLRTVIEKTAKIGYERFIKGAKVLRGADFEKTKMKFISIENLRQHPEDYTIIDVRSPSEYKAEKAFPQSINVPLSELMERAEDIGNGKPVAVHCAGGYRSAIAASIIERATRKQVFDIGDEIKKILG